MPLRRGIFALIIFLSLVAGGLPAAQASTEDLASAPAGAAASPGREADAGLVSVADRDMSALPAASAADLASNPSAVSLPNHSGLSAEEYAAVKAAAAANSSATATAGQSGRAVGLTPNASADTATFTPNPSPQFNGLNDNNNAALLGFTLQPSDQALAANGSFVLQAVNDVVAVYSTGGVLQAGWPKTLASFFGVPFQSCEGSFGPFMTDPRAFFDPGDGRFWVLADEVEGNGVFNNCPNQSLIWVAVSATASPTGSYHIYAFNRQNSFGQNDWADYPTFGYDDNGMYFGTNQFTVGGGSFVAATYGGCNKKTMEAGGSPFCSFFFGPSVGGVAVDTMQPVENPGSKIYGWPQTEFFVNSFNILFGGGQCRNGCSGLVVWSFHFTGSAGANVTGVVVGSNSYSLSPGADDPGHCTGCIETLDTRISATPVYRDGFIWTALETGVNNGSRVVPGILWMKTAAIVDDPPTVPIDGATFIEQQGYYFYGGDGAAFFGAIMPDSEGNAFMVFNFSGNGLNPSAAIVSRRAVNQKNAWQDSGLCMVCPSNTPTADTRWGDYSATSYDGTANHVWVATQFSNGDWATRVGREQYSPTQP